jgi:hypothetical protein
MCLKIEKHIEPSIAEEDITVYKMVKVYGKGKKMEITSAYWSYNWTLGKEEQVEMIRDEDTNGAHDDREITDYRNISNIIHITEGFHSARTSQRLGRANDNWYQRKIQCIIPKGALYYHNLSDLYVSNRLIPVKLLRKR